MSDEPAPPPRPSGGEERAPGGPPAWRALSPFLDRALELDPGEREGWLGELATTEPEIATEVRALLEELDRLDQEGFLTPRPRGAAGGEPSLAGQQVGAWVLERPLGRGGMGSVWLARRSDGRFEGRAAVKLLDVSRVALGGEPRFRREGSALARLSHPNIARLLDAGVTAGGQPYLVLEHVDGARIDHWCAERDLDVPSVLYLFRQVLDAVGHAHQSLVVHRDIKPSNILVTDTGTVKLLDFGIAKLLEGESGEAMAAVTVEGASALTPEFAAPEQVAGGEITTATDVYALGVLLYLLLSGRHPTAEGRRGPAEAIQALFEAEPPRLGLGDLDNVLAKALRKAAGERYGTVAALADDLERYQRHEPVAAREPSWSYRARKFLRRHRAAVAGSAAVAASLVGATVFSVAQMREARRQSLEAERQRDAAVYEKARADAQLEFQALLFSSIGTEPVTMSEVLDQGRVLLERDYAGDPRVAASIALDLGERYDELGAYEPGAEMLTRAESLAVRSGAEDVRLRARCSRALNLQDRYDRDGAMALLDSLRPAIGTAAPSAAAACLSELAQAEVQAGEYDSAAVMGTRAVALLDSLGDTRGSTYLSALNNMANALENLKRRREALEVYDRAAAVMDATGRGRSMGRTVLKNNIGIALSNLGEMTAAGTILHEALDEFGHSNPSGEVHPTIIVNYCGAALFLRQLDSAAVWYRRLVVQTEAQGAEGMPDAEEGAYGMAEVELARGRLDEAARWIAEDRRISASLARPRPENVATLEGALAHARGDPASATTRFREALRATGYFDGERRYKMRRILVRASAAALDAGEPTDALGYARAAHDIAVSDSLSEVRSAWVGEARLLEARALLALGDTTGARDTVERALVALRSGAGEDHPRTVEASRLRDALGG